MEPTETMEPALKKESLFFTHLELLFVVAIWSGTFVATKFVLAQISPVISALYRYLIASAILLLLYSRKREKINRQDVPLLFLLGLSGVTFYYLLQHYGIQYTNAIDASILISLSPAFIGLISWLFLKEALKPLTLFGLFLSLAGAILVINNGQFNLGQLESRLWGNILILLTAVSWAVYSVFGKKLLIKYQTLTLITWTTLIGTAGLIPFSLLELTSAPHLTLDWFGWLNMLYLGGAASVYGYLAWYRALTKLPSVTVGSYLYFRPLLTGIIASLLLKEEVGVLVVAGGCLIILGTFLSTKS
jgi:drug/metabolite transporter (DMT)-like permease